MRAFGSFRAQHASKTRARWPPRFRQLKTRSSRCVTRHFGQETATRAAANLTLLFAVSRRLLQSLSTPKLYAMFPPNDSSLDAGRNLLAAFAGSSPPNRSLHATKAIRPSSVGLAAAHANCKRRSRSQSRRTKLRFR